MTRLISITTIWLATGALSMADGEPFPLWNSATPLPRSNEIPLLEGVRFDVIKKCEPEVDGYRWLHGVALGWHGNNLFCSWGHNKGVENSPGEVVQGSHSKDFGRTWSAVRMIATGDSKLAASHGAFLSHGDNLWGFFARFRGKINEVLTEAYVFDFKTDRWESRGIVLGDGFWPMAEPQRLDNGNWIMAGFCVRNGQYPPAVAISHGDDFTSWDLLVIPKPANMDAWGESAVVVQGQQVLCIARYGPKAIALASKSDDYGRTWTELRESNLPMVTSKPYAGTLSTGQHYLIGGTMADAGQRRSPLTIAVTRPGELLFCKVYRVRDAVRPGEDRAKPAALAYPYAVERAGKLYVGYSVGRHGGNENDAELAVIPIETLKPE